MEAENNKVDNTRSQADRKKIHDYVYRFCDKIGVGNFSKVFKGIHEPTGRTVAIKTIELSSLNTPRLLELLNTETLIMKSLDHPNVIRCEEILSSFRNCYIITELCEGGDVDKLLKSKGNFREIDIYEIAVDVYEGLKYLTENHIIHRDLKISNVFLHQGKYKIADFGFAQISQKAFTDISVGSPLYMSPEGYIDHIYGPKTDVWAYGIMLYELVCGVTPFNDCSNQSQLKKCLEKQLTIENLSGKIISSQLKNLIIQCLTIQQSQRITISQIGQSQWMKRAQRKAEELRTTKNNEKQNLRKISSLEERTYMIHNLKKNNNDLLKKLENNSILLREEKQKEKEKDKKSTFTYKYNNFLRINDKQREDKLKEIDNKFKDAESKQKKHQDSSCQESRKHSTIEKKTKKLNEHGIRRSGNDQNKGSGKVFYSPKNDFGIIPKNYHQILAEQKPQDLLTMGNKSELLNNHSVKPSSYFKNYQPKPLENNNKSHNHYNAAKVAGIDQRKELFMGSPQSLIFNPTSTANKTNSVLQEYKRYFNSSSQFKGPLETNSCELKPNSMQVKSKLNKKIEEEVLERAKSKKIKGKSDEKESEIVQSLNSTNLSPSIFQETGVSSVVNRVVTFSDCIGIIHYCRLSYKFSCILEEIGGEESSKVFYRCWTIQLLKEIMNKIKRCDVLYGGESLQNNSSMGVNNPNTEKKNRLQLVTKEYLTRYNDANCQSTHNFTLKEASNLTYDLYLKKVHEFKRKSKQKHPELFFAMISYLRMLEKQTKILMEYCYQMRDSIDGKFIEKLLAIKVTDFNRKLVEEIIEEGHFIQT